MKPIIYRLTSACFRQNLLLQSAQQTTDLTESVLHSSHLSSIGIQVTGLASADLTAASVTPGNDWMSMSLNVFLP